MQIEDYHNKWLVYFSKNKYKEEVSNLTILINFSEVSIIFPSIRDVVLM